MSDDRNQQNQQNQRQPRGADPRQDPRDQRFEPIPVASLHFLALEGVRLPLRCCEGEGTIHNVIAGKHRKGWTTEIVYEPWSRRLRVTESEGGRVVKSCCIPESAATYVLEGS